VTDVTKVKGLVNILLTISRYDGQVFTVNARENR